MNDNSGYYFSYNKTVAISEVDKLKKEIKDLKKSLDYARGKFSAYEYVINRMIEK